MRTTLFIIIILVFSISTASVLLYGDHFLIGSYNKQNNDDVKYINSAKILLNKHTIAYNSGDDPSAFIMPGMPVVLAGLMLIFGQGDGGVVAFRVLMAALQAFSIYLIFIAANQLFNSRAAIIACIATALYLPDYFSSGAILSETMFRTLFILLICFSLLALRRQETRYYIISAAIVGLACYFKPHAVLFPVVWFILWLVQKISWKIIVKYTAVISLTLILLLSPWWIRNYVTFDKFIPFTQSAGNPMLLGALINNKAPSKAFFDTHLEYEGISENLFAGSDAAQAETAQKIVSFGFKNQPLKYLKWYTIDKVFGLYAAPYYWKTVFGVNIWIAGIYHVVFMLFGAAGLLITLKRAFRQKEIAYLFLLLSLAYFTLIYIPFVAFNRYGYPNVFLFFMSAGFFIDWAIAKYQSTSVKNHVTANL